MNIDLSNATKEQLTAALQNVLTGCDHLDRMRPTFSSAEARMAYADATKHIRACLTVALTPGADTTGATA